MHQSVFSDIHLPSIRSVFLALLFVPVWIGNSALKKGKHHLEEYEETHEKVNLILFVMYDFITLACIAPLLSIMFNFIMSMEDFNLSMDDFNFDDSNWEGFMILCIVLMFAPVLMGTAGFFFLRRTEQHLMQYKETREKGDFVLGILWGFLTLVSFAPLMLFLLFHMKESLI